MKVALFDPYLGKFTEDMTSWWRSQGHEVRTDRYYDPELVVWGDLIYFFTCDNNLLSATSPGDAIQGAKFFENREIPWDMHAMDLMGKKVVVQPIDIEVWGGSHAHVEMWDLVDNCIFIAPHIRDIAMADSRTQGHKMKIDTIPLGLDLNKWTFKERTHGKKVAIVSEKWIIKGMQNILQIAYDLPRDYEFHWLGIWSNDYPYFRDYALNFIERNNLNFTFVDHVDNVDEWLEDKNYHICASMKEAWSAATAEAMAKGIKPIIHHFYGAEHIWPGLTFSSPSEAVKDILEGPYDSESYRRYLTDHGYTIGQMMERMTKVIG